jgi:hypothetical protein
MSKLKKFYLILLIVNIVCLGFLTWFCINDFDVRKLFGLFYIITVIMMIWFKFKKEGV